MQENLKKQVKVVKALYGEDFKYKDIAEMLEININSFYNWLNNYYDLGKEKEKVLQDFVNNILY